jgi:hypothetical protein
MSETITTTTVAAPKTERAAKLQKAAAKVAKHTAGINGTADSKRTRLFKLLSKKPNGLTNVQIREALKTQSIAAMCRDEVVHGRLKRVASPEGSRGAVFALTAKGKSDLEKGKVDSNKAPVAK